MHILSQTVICFNQVAVTTVTIKKQDYLKYWRMFVA